MILLATLTAGPQQTFAGKGKTTQELLTAATIARETDHIYDKLVAIRRDLHANPELAGNEKRTRDVIKRYLSDLGLEVQTGTYGQSVIGILKGGKKGKKIAWRSDMDALPNDFADEETFRSVMKGVQHGCGHDVHMAVALGIAEVLSRHKASLAGTVYFIFQPEEETFAGAKNMVDHGLLSTIQPDEIYGLHVTPLPAGKIMVKPGEVFAYQRQVRIELKNELTKDEAKALAGQIRSALVRSVKGSKPWEIQQISDPVTGLANTNTIFKDYLIMDERFHIRSDKDRLFLEAYLYETDPQQLEQIIPRIQALIGEGPYKDKLLAVSYIQGNPTVINDKELTGKAIAVLQSCCDNDVLLPDYGLVPFFNDDFAYFQQKVPGVYFFLGGSDVGKGIVAMNHAPGFRVAEESIRTGVKRFATLLAERLKP